MYKYSKDGATVQVTLDSRRPKLSGKYPVKIQVTYKRTQKYYSTGKELTVEEWDKISTTKVRSLVDTRIGIENSFSIIRDEVEYLVSNAKFTFGELKTRLGRGLSGSVNTAFDVKIQSLQSSGHIGNMKIYITILRGLERFGGKNISFDSITPEWLSKYEKFLVSENKTRSTISMHLRTLRAIVNEALRSGVIKEGNYPFGKGKFEIQEGEGRKLALPLEQIGQITRFDDGSQTTARYRDYWLFMYYCNGMNVADFINLKYKNILGDEICFLRQKTKHTVKKQKEIRAAMTPRMNEIINRWGNPPQAENYIFPILTLEDKDPELIFKKKNHFTRAVNKRMKKIGDALGIENITTYTARHSFATVLKLSGVNIAYISESLGHNNLTTTETYLASFEKEERQKNAVLLTRFK